MTSKLCHVVAVCASAAVPLPPSLEGTQGCMQGGRQGSAQRLGPALGLKKSSSLESLQTALQVLELHALLHPDLREGGSEAEERLLGAVGGFRRGRAFNSSFRAAVDRSYEGQGETAPLSPLTSPAVRTTPTRALPPPGNNCLEYFISDLLKLRFFLRIH